MAVLSEADRAGVWRAYMRDEATPHGAVLKADIRAAVNAIDDYFEANASAINAAIPQPARGALTVTQKSRLLRYVLQRRYG